MEKSRFIKIMTILNRRGEYLFESYFQGNRSDELWDRYNGFMRAANDFYNQFIEECYKPEIDIYA